MVDVGFDFDLVSQNIAPELEFVLRLPLATKWDLPPVPFVIPKRKKNNFLFLFHFISIFF